MAGRESEFLHRSSGVSSSGLGGVFWKIKRLFRVAEFLEERERWKDIFHWH
jgi:hypothetical protein